MASLAFSHIWILAAQEPVSVEHGPWTHVISLFGAKGPHAAARNTKSSVIELKPAIPHKPDAGVNHGRVEQLTALGQYFLEGGLDAASDAGTQSKP